MAQSPTNTCPVDQKGSNLRDDRPPPTRSDLPDVTECHQPSRWRRIMTCIVLICTMLLLAYRCERYLSSRPEHPLSTTNDQRLHSETQVLYEDVLANAEVSFLRRPTMFDTHYLRPTHKTCLEEWVPNTVQQSSPFVTPLGDRRLRATSSFTLRRDVHTYMMHIENFDQLSTVDLHVVPSPDEYTTVSIDAFYDEPIEMDAFSACTMHADDPKDRYEGVITFADGTRSRNIYELQKADMFWLHQGQYVDKDTTEPLYIPEARVWFNITLAIPPATDRSYSLNAHGLDMALHSGLALNEVMLSGGEHTVLAYEGFSARKLVDYFHVYEAAINLHLEATHSLVDTVQAIKISANKA
ncbi:hypothetical protein PENSPDRAFT_734523 [Peniophora sp. CONT]|nr:hypothetical protein PENSPDRAFT_734523 [Peniophora sp. CONT]